VTDDVSPASEDLGSGLILIPTLDDIRAVVRAELHRNNVAHFLPGLAPDKDGDFPPHTPWIKFGADESTGAVVPRIVRCGSADLLGSHHTFDNLHQWAEHYAALKLTELTVPLTAGVAREFQEATSSRIAELTADRDQARIERDEVRAELSVARADVGIPGLRLLQAATTPPTPVELAQVDAPTTLWGIKTNGEFIVNQAWAKAVVEASQTATPDPSPAGVVATPTGAERQAGAGPGGTTPKSGGCNCQRCN